MAPRDRSQPRAREPVVEARQRLLEDGAGMLERLEVQDELAIGRQPAAHGISRDERDDLFGLEPRLLGIEADDHTRGHRFRLFSEVEPERTDAHEPLFDEHELYEILEFGRWSAVEIGHLLDDVPRLFVRLGGGKTLIVGETFAETGDMRSE